jgi:hypothetical protein
VCCRDVAETARRARGEEERERGRSRQDKVIDK